MEMVQSAKDANGGYPWPAVIFLCVFLAMPIGGVITSLHGLLGFNRLVVKDGRGVLYYGIGKLQLKKPFLLEPNTKIYIDSTTGKNARTFVCIEGRKKIRFATHASDEQRNYAVAFLNRLKG